MRRLLSPPVFADEAQTQRAGILHTIALSTMTIGGVFFTVMIAFQPQLWQRGLLLIAFFTVVCGAAVALAKAGRIVPASWLLLLGLTSAVTVASLTAGGIRAPGITAFLVFVVIAGLILGERGAIAYAVLAGAISLGLVLAGAMGVLPAQRAFHSDVTRMMLLGLLSGVMIVLMRLTNNAMRSALQRAESELAERRTAEKERDRLVLRLGERVKELDLLHRVAKLLQADRPFDRRVLAELVMMIPRAMLHPASAVARVSHAGVEAATPGWQSTPWRMTQDFTTTIGAGRIEVGYLTEQPVEDDGPFLHEERTLLSSLAEMLEAYISHDQAERDRAQLEHQLRQSQKMEALGTLVGGIAHDFNNLLAAISANTDLALADLPDGHPARTSVDEIAKAHARARSLVKRILLFSRRQESERRPIALAPIVDEAARLLRASIPSMIRIHTRYANDLPQVLADASQVHQVIMNLGTNAAHAMGDSGGDLTLQLDRVMVGIAGDPLPPGEYVQLTVADTGTGMGPEIVDRVFEPFFSTKGSSGTGLGLAVVHGIVREHDGHIEVESEVGKGTRIHAWFPATTPTSPEPAEEPESLIRGHGQHLMYVDDEAALVFVMTRTLERLGYQCTGFSDPATALHAFRTTPDAFDAVITDYAMPGMTGEQFAVAVMAIRPSVPVVLTTGYGALDAMPEGGPRFAARWHKPISIEALSRAVAALFAPPA